MDYAYGQLILSGEARNLCIFVVNGGDFTGYYRFLKGFYGLADIPTIFQEKIEKIDQTLENKHPAWLDAIIIVTKGSKEQHKKELIEVLPRLENAGYRLSENKSDWPQNRPKRNQTVARQTNGDKKYGDKKNGDKKKETTQQRKGYKIVLGGYSKFV